MFDVALEWFRCPDGVELCEFDPDEGLGQPGPYVKFRSDRRTSFSIERIDLEKPVVLQFINCRSTEAQLAFHMKYGFLHQPSRGDRSYIWQEPSLDFMRERETFAINRVLGGFVEKAINAAPSERADIVNNRLFNHVKLTPTFDFLGEGQKPRVVLNADDLLQFMAAEIAVAAISDVGLVRCASCDDAFFTGAAAHRRSHAKTCSSRCRSAFMRRSRWSTASA